MNAYAYRAMAADGRIRRGRLDAVSPADLERRLKRLGLDLIAFANASPQRRFGTGVPRRELIHFCFHLEQLVGTGVPIVDCLADLRDSIDHRRFRDVLAAMLESVEGGHTLSQAMAEHPRVFDTVMVGLVRSGEDTGKLDEVLASLAASLKWRDELAAQTRRLALYPAFLGVVLLGLTLFFIAYLVPKTAALTASLGQATPPETRMLIAASGLVANYWHLALGGGIAFAALAFLAVRTRPGARRVWDNAMLNAPVVGSILKKIVLSRFVGTFAMMYGAGIPVPDAVRAGEKVVGNVVVEQGLQQVGRMIADGENVATAFAGVGLFPPLVVRMLKVGEATGALDRALANVGYFYDRDVRESVEHAQALLEPLLTVIVGAVMGWIMLSVLGPIYDVVARIKV